MEEEKKPKIPQESDVEASIEGPLDEKAPAPQGGQPPFPEGGVRAWSVAIGCAGVLFSTFGYVNAFGVFQEYYQTHQLIHETPSTISWIGSLQTFFLFGGSLVGGPLFDRFGAKVIWPAATAYIFAVMMTSLCTEFYQFLLAQGILGGISMGMTMAPAMAATGQYFNKKRGAAMGLAVAGSSLGGIVWPIALGKMLNNPNLTFGWSIRIAGFIMLALIAPACAAIKARLPPRNGTFFLPEAFTNVQFLGVVGSTAMMMLGLFLPFFYLPTFAVEKGMSTELASYIIAILNAASFFGRVIPGVLGDKLGRYNAFSAAGLSSGVLLICMQWLNSNASIIVFSALYGFCSGAIVSGMSVVLAQVPKDAREIGTYMGMGMATVSIAALVGPPIDGAFQTHYHSFHQVSTFSGVMVLAGGVSILLTKSTTEKGLFGKV